MNLETYSTNTSIAHLVAKRMRLSRTAWVDYYENFLEDEAGYDLMHTLIADENWEQRRIKAFDKEVIQPRLMSWGGDIPYRYSGQTLELRSIHPQLLSLWPKVEALCQCSFNHVVLNYYRDGKDHMGMHADDEKELGRDPLIAAISLGITRKFHMSLKYKKARRRIYKLQLHHGSLMVMGGDMQHRWRHAVPKSKDPQKQGERINVTFRNLLMSPIKS